MGEATQSDCLDRGRIVGPLRKNGERWADYTVSANSLAFSNGR